ncbi:hypothetical protein EVAR_17302_1 [Eumeta japonica]|uniref:Uncharacterized protein n=1 Tax=Eumeta variegata TaxID=151549 RepID=A0A4C1TT36_EUMVA|nr:hypothetical protein EVAR_17302_1 [Eumeta japonica]
MERRQGEEGAWNYLRKSGLPDATSPHPHSVRMWHCTGRADPFLSCSQVGHSMALPQYVELRILYRYIFYFIKNGNRIASQTSRQNTHDKTRQYTISSGCSAIAIGCLRSIPLDHPFSLVCHCICSVPSSRVPESRAPRVYECVWCCAAFITWRQLYHFFVRPGVPSGLLHRLYAEPTHVFCA